MPFSEEFFRSQIRDAQVAAQEFRDQRDCAIEQNRELLAEVQNLYTIRNGLLDELAETREAKNRLTSILRTLQDQLDSALKESIQIQAENDAQTFIAAANKNGIVR